MVSESASLFPDGYRVMKVEGSLAPIQKPKLQIYLAMELTEKQLQEVASIIADKVALNTKEVLTFEEACTYTGLSKSAMYKHTMNATVPCYRPTGKLVYFNRQELIDWLLQNRYATDAEIADKAQHYCRKGVAV